MTPGGRGHPDESAAPLPLLDAYLDGQLTGPARDAFEARLSRDAGLAAEVELQRRMDGSLCALFVATPFPGLPANGHPHHDGNGAHGTNGHAGQPATPPAPAAAASPDPSNRRRLWRWSAAAAVLVLAVGASASWMAYQAFADPRQGFAEVYRAQFLTGELPAPAPPAATQATARSAAAAFEAECIRTFGRALGMKSLPDGLELQGVGAVPVLSKHTVMLRARLHGDGVLVFVDRAAHDDGGAAARSASGCGGGCCGVRVHRRLLGDLVLYEMSPSDTPSLIEAFEFQPAPHTRCSGDAPGSPLEEI